MKILDARVYFDLPITYDYDVRRIHYYYLLIKAGSYTCNCGFLLCVYNLIFPSQF